MAGAANWILTAIALQVDTRINARSSRGVRMISGAAAGLAAYPATSP
jgi:hypothetical protein